MNCSECGERLVDGARFCSACGRRVTPDIPKSVLEPPRMPRARVQQARSGLQATPKRVEPKRAPPGRGVVQPTTIASAPAQLTGFAGVLHKVGPGGMIAAGVLVALAAYWSAARDDAFAKAEAALRLSKATQPLPTSTQDPAPRDGAFSTRQALQGLYGSYDPNLDGVFWTVSGAPREWGEWNGKQVVIKPLVSRTDESGTRHVLVTNSVEVRDGLVVKQGAACPGCKSLLGAALFERHGNEWVLVTEHRFMRIGGAFGAPPKVTVDFPRNAGVEVRMESATGDPGRTRSTVHAVILHGGKPAAVPPVARQDG